MDLTEGLRRIDRDLDHYYRFEGPLSEAEGPVRIGIGLHRPGAEVRHRRSAGTVSWEDELLGRTRGALMYDATPNPLGVALDVGSAQLFDGEDMVPIRLRIPVENMTLDPGDEEHTARLRIFVGERDSRGDFSPVRGAGVSITIPDDELEEARSEDYVYVIRLLMSEGEHEVAVGVYDELGAVASFLEEEVRVDGGLR